MSEYFKTGYWQDYKVVLAHNIQNEPVYGYSVPDYRMERLLSEIAELQQELADTKKKLEKIEELWSEWKITPVGMVFENHFKLEKELEAFKKESDDKLREALEVIGFYGDENNWKRSNKQHFAVITVNDCEEKNISYKPIGYSFNKVNVAGKLARSFLKRCEQSELLQKHTTKMEG